MIAKNLLGRKKKGAASLVSIFIGVAIAVLIVVSVALPIINQAIATANVTGPAQSLLGMIPLLLIVALVLLVVGLYKFK